MTSTSSLETGRALVARSVSKTFGTTRALDGVDILVRPGTVHALVGENGAGKSTLMKILSGATLPDAGTILLDGRPVAIDRPATAAALGIRTVHQEFSLLPHMSVAENMLLGRMPTRSLPVPGLSFVVDWPAANRLAGEVLADFGFPDIDPRALVRDLSVARQQIVEIAKALAAGPQILILDEPTAVLSASETQILFRRVRALAAQGATILYISHRLEEIFEIADRIVVLKDGRSVLEGAVAELDEEQLIRAMVGRPLSAIFPERRGAAGAPVLEVAGLGRDGAFGGIDFSVHAGEIVGMFGLVGSGRTEIAQAIFGARPADRGRIVLNGRAQRFASPAQAVGAGLAMVTEDRKGDGLALEASVQDNAVLASYSRIARLGVIDAGRRQDLVAGQIADLSIRPAEPERPVRQLSGGNQQKVVLAKWLLAPDRDLFIFDEPTRGVDIATKAEIYQIMRDLADRGVAVLLISSEMPEVLGLSDRVLVVRDGRLVAELPPAGLDAETVFAHAAGLPVPGGNGGTAPPVLH
ncbi:MAG TPA: sugar ABC transporter ATP-binding protein [Microbacterium sp.]|nr:sugar ABC transporter ATP-binding protein [Microbacterium sp.]